MKVIGLHVGSFDPPHRGHLDLCNQAFSRGITDIIIVPAFSHPDKSNWAPYEKRMEMCNLQFNDSRMYVSDIEKRIAKDGEKTYTRDTVVAIKNELEETIGDNFYLRLLVGEDLAQQVPRWKNSSRLLELAPLMVLKRGDLSSTEIRNGFINDDLNLGALTNEVFEYILKNGLYGAEVAE